MSEPRLTLFSAYGIVLVIYYEVNLALRESSAVTRHAGAEGATAPETLRHQDRREMTLWRAGMRSLVTKI